MRIFEPVLRLFETWIDPFGGRADLQPPDSIWPFFWHYLGQARWAYLSVLITSGLVALVEAGFFYYMGRLVDMLDQAPREAGWAGLIAAHGPELALIVVVVLGGRVVVGTLNSLIEEQTLGRGFDNLVRWQAYAYVSRQSMAFFGNDYSGRLVTKVSQAAQALHSFLGNVIQVVWFTLIYVGTTALLFAQLDWRMAGLVLVWVVTFGLMAWYFVPRMRARASENAEMASMVNGRIVDSFSNIQTIKLFGNAEENDSYVRNGFERYIGSATSLGRMVVGVRFAMGVQSTIMLLAFGGLSVQLWADGLITVGAVAFAMSLILRLNMMLGRFMGHMNALMRNFGVVQNAMETIARPLGLTDAPDAIDWTPARGHIRFEGVEFTYTHGQKVLGHLDLEIRPGERVGLVGRSGAGKSTIVTLLLRLYDIDAGRILIDGQDIAGVKQDSLRAAIGVVTQDTSLLHRTVRDNILFGRTDATEDEMIAAAKRAEAHDFIMKLSDPRGRTGYSAQVGERGVKLSGGQRQRIAIARVILKDAPILVLDEATSALDSEVEAAIQSQLAGLMEGKTVIAIAHRLSTIAAMDRLIVLDEGRIVEQGTHAELLRLNGHYARLWAHQSGGFLGTEEETEKAAE